MVNGVKIQKFKRALPEAKNFVAIFGCVLCDTHTQVTGDTFQPNHSAEPLLPILDELYKRSLCFVAKCLQRSSGLIRFITSHGIFFAAGLSLMGKNVTFCSARYNLKTYEFASGVVNVNRLIQQHCRRAMSVSGERLCQFILDLIRCRDWYGSDDECILSTDEICDLIKFLAAG